VVIHLIKFMHLLFALSLFATTFICLIYTFSPKFSASKRLNAHKLLLVFSLLAMISGTLLVYPKNYTFQTTWIQAAYFLLLLIGFIISLLIFFHKKPKRIWAVGYLIILLLLSLIIHDAVRKTTLLNVNILYF
jgi:hypothetical protein